MGRLKEKEKKRKKSCGEIFSGIDSAMSKIQLQYNPGTQPATKEEEAEFIKGEIFSYGEVRYKNFSDEKLAKWIEYYDFNLHDAEIRGRGELHYREMLQVLLAEHERRCQAKK